MKTAHAEFGGYTSYAASSAPAHLDADLSVRRGDDSASLADSTGIPPALRGSIRVLIVDDDRTLREGCASVLQVEGFNVTVTGRGDDAIEMIKRSRFDIMLVDVCMTPVSGMDILKAVMATSPSTIVVMMTGNPSVGSSVEALRIGAWDYLPKPYSGTHLQLLLGRAAHAVLARREREDSRSATLGNAGNSDKITLLGASPALRRAVELARKDCVSGSAEKQLEMGAGIRLWEIVPGADAQGLDARADAVIARHHDDDCARRRGHDRLEDVHSGHRRHANVHQHDVEARPLDHLDRVVTTAGDRDVESLDLQDARATFPQRAIVVYDEDANTAAESGRNSRRVRQASAVVAATHRKVSVEMGGRGRGSV